MRVVLITPEYPPGDRLGGIATNTHALAVALAQRGHEVCVVTRGTRDETAVQDGFEVVRLRHRWLPWDAAAELTQRARIALAARRFNPDVIHAAEWSGDAWALARWTRRPVVTRLATPSHVVEELNGATVDARARRIHRFEREQTERSAVVYAPTNAIIQRVTQDWSLPTGRVRLIPNPVSIEATRSAGEGPSPSDLPARFVVFLGRIERRKGVEALGQALAAALAHDTELHAVLIGNDPGEDGGAVMAGLQRALAPVVDRVHILGELPRQDALAVVARAELALVPSLWESFGYVCVEAMALGVPVIASDTGGLAEIVSHGETGWLTPVGDGDALAATIVARLADPAGTNVVAQAARERANDFDVEVLIDRVEDVLRDAADHASFDPTIYRSGYRRYFRPEEARDPFAALYAEKRERVLAHFASGAPRRIVDVGGGFGRLSGPLAQRHHVVHCDLGAEMLVEARTRNGPSLALVQADGRQLPFEHGSFDAVLALDLLVHLDDLEGGLRELTRVLAPGGEIVFDTTNADAWWVLRYPAYTNWRPRRTWQTLRGDGVLPEWRALVRHQRAEEVRAACDATGLRIRQSFGVGPKWSPKWHVWVASANRG